MTIKELAYSTQQYLQTRSGSPFKRSHIHELLAATFGFNSYASFRSGAIFTERHTDADHSYRHDSAIRQRCIELGYQAATAEIAASELPALVAKYRIGCVSLSRLVAALRAESSFRGGYPEWDEDDLPDDDPEEMLTPTWPVLDDEAFSPILLEGLGAAASKGNALAHYALALIHEDETEQEVGSDYWYSQAQQGRVLTGVEQEWAEAHAQRLAAAEKYAFHLREAARLGNDQALLDLAETFGDPTFFEKVHDTVDDDPVRVAEIAERLGRLEDARYWLTTAAEAGDTGAMRCLIEEFDHNDQLRCWTWLYFARLVGTDLTKNEYYAIHEDGSYYDDDVGGPAFVAGRGGVEIAPLNAEQDAATRQRAQDLFKRMSGPG